MQFIDQTNKPFEPIEPAIRTFHFQQTISAHQSIKTKIHQNHSHRTHSLRLFKLIPSNPFPWNLKTHLSIFISQPPSNPKPVDASNNLIEGPLSKVFQVGFDPRASRRLRSAKIDAAQQSTSPVSIFHPSNPNSIPSKPHTCKSIEASKQQISSKPQSKNQRMVCLPPRGLAYN